MPFNSDAIRLFRERERMSQYDLGVLIEVTPQSILNYEKGRTKPNTEVLDRLYKAAYESGHEDLEFYKTPKRKSKQ